jgi:hypothetical protein
VEGRGDCDVRDRCEKDAHADIIDLDVTDKARSMVGLLRLCASTVFVRERAAGEPIET